MVLYNDCINATNAPIHLSISCYDLPSLVNKTPRWYFTWECNSLPTLTLWSMRLIFWPGEHLTCPDILFTGNPPFSMASDSEVLTLIPTTSDLAVNHPSKRRWAHQDNIIHKEQRCHSKAPKLNILYPLAVPWDPVCEYLKQDRWPETALVESSTHWKQAWLAAENVNAAFTPLASLLPHTI